MSYSNDNLFGGVGDLKDDDLFHDHNESGGELIFGEDQNSTKTPVKKGKWKILIVDDEEDIHGVTKLALDDFDYKDKDILFLDTYSGEEAKKVIEENDDIAIILLDVVMESSHAGLELVQYIRENLGKNLPRIILRTGQLGQAPEKEVIRTYEINDYKTKTELTSNKLFTVILAGLRSYESLLEIKEHAATLEEKIEERTKEITDSIHYASSIQQAIFTPQEGICEMFPGNFIINRPQNIVSGDFYWFLQRDNKIFFTVADCTGHGVPGAFMSMLGIAFLNEIVMNNKYIPANEILNELRKYVIKALHQKGRQGDTRDGMDMSFCIYEKEYKKLQFAGANSPIYVLRNNELIQYKGNKMPIGYYEDIKSFTNHEIQLESGDELVLFSDGFPDQFGGQNGKKFKYEPFKQMLLKCASKSMAEQKFAIEKTLDDWMGMTNPDGKAHAQIDDITVVGIRV